jgi:hypothetical protein
MAMAAATTAAMATPTTTAATAPSLKHWWPAPMPNGMKNKKCQVGHHHQALTYQSTLIFLYE